MQLKTHFGIQGTKKMVCFQDLFLESGGKSVEYDGKTVQMFHRLEVPNGKLVEVTFESTDSDWKQGISLSAKGDFLINDIKYSKAVVFWEDTSPKVVQFSLSSRDGIVNIKNVWDTGDGVMHSWHNGAAMIVDKDKEFLRFLCNDGVADDDFNDLIFRIRFI